MLFQIVPVTHYQQNCSIIWCEQTQDAAVIDPGGDVDHLLDVVANLGVNLKKIFLTHGHMDHVGGTAELVKRLQLPIEGPHSDDQFWIDGLNDQALYMGFKPVDGFVPGRWLADGDRLHLGEVVLEVLHCPGHTPGHVVFFHRPTKLAFVGDVIFKGAVGRTDFPRGNHQQLIDSIRNKLWPLGEDVRFVPGHGPMSTVGDERRSNAFVADVNFG